VKKILLFVVIGIAAIVLIGFIGKRLLFNKIFSTPDDLKNIAVLVEDQSLEKKLLYYDERMGRITDIVIDTENNYKDFYLGVACSNGAVFFNDRMEFLYGVPISEPGDLIKIIDVDGDGEYELLNRQGVFKDRKAALYDASGALVWSYNAEPEGHGVNMTSAGDMDGDGIQEFAVGFNGGTGVHLLDHQGEIIWSFPDSNVWHLETADLNNDGTDEIIHTREGGAIVVRDAQGEIISQEKPSVRITDFSLCRYPEKTGRHVIISAQNKSIALVHEDGSIVASLDAPRCRGLGGHARGALVKFRPDEPAYLVVVVAYKHWHRSLIYVYNSDRELLYQEIFGDTCKAVAALPSTDGSNRETLLIGSKNKVCEYIMH
jgi:hypothetical protein